MKYQGGRHHQSISLQKREGADRNGSEIVVENIDQNRNEKMKIGARYKFLKKVRVLHFLLQGKVYFSIPVVVVMFFKVVCPFGVSILVKNHEGAKNGGP